MNLLRSSKDDKIIRKANTGSKTSNVKKFKFKLQLKGDVHHLPGSPQFHQSSYHYQNRNPSSTPNPYAANTRFSRRYRTINSGDSESHQLNVKINSNTINLSPTSYHDGTNAYVSNKKGLSFHKLDFSHNNLNLAS